MCLSSHVESEVMGIPLDFENWFEVGKPCALEHWHMYCCWAVWQEKQSPAALCQCCQPGCGFPELELLWVGAYGEDFPYFHTDHFLNLIIYSVSLTYQLFNGCIVFPYTVVF